MKHLYSILAEGLLDIEDNIKNADTRVMLKKHPDWRYSKGWTVLDPPQERIGYGWDHKANVYVDGKSNGDSWDLEDLKHNKFRALEALTIDSRVDANPVLSALNGASVSWIDIRYATKDIDFTKMKTPVNRIIRIMSENPVDVKAYNKHVNLVHFAKTRWCETPAVWTPDNVKGWDCDCLVVDNSFFEVEGALGHGENKLNGYWIDRCQALIDNNPKSKDIYLYDRDLDIFYRLTIQGAKRRFKNIVNRKKVFNNYYDSEIRWCKYDVEQWKHDHIDLYDLSAYKDI
jgi:hypothetical protein